MVEGTATRKPNRARFKEKIKDTQKVYKPSPLMTLNHYKMVRVIIQKSMTQNYFFTHYEPKNALLTRTCSYCCIKHRQSYEFDIFCNTVVVGMRTNLIVNR